MPATEPTDDGRKTGDQYVLRFDKPGHRDRLKIQAIQEKRSLNKHILHLIEQGEAAEQARTANAAA